MTETMNECLVCESHLSTFFEDVYDTRFGVQGEFDIFRCNVCGLVQLGRYHSLSEIKRIYENFYNYGGDEKGIYVWLRKAFMGSVFYRIWMVLDGDICFHSRRGDGRLLDIGCNEGQGLQIYKKNGFQADGLELNERAASKARKKGFQVYCESLENFDPEIPYDVIVMSHVLEHCDDPKAVLSQVARLLKPEGELWISCPNILSWQKNMFRQFWINWHVPFHYCFFSIGTLKSLISRCGFEVLRIKYITPSLWIAQSTIAALYAKNGQVNYPQRYAMLLGFLIIIARLLFFPLLWIGNLLKRGDCITIESKKKAK